MYVGIDSLYGGNVISSLKCLSGFIKQKGGRVVWMLPKEASSRDWFSALQDRETIIPFDRTQKVRHRARQMRHVLTENQIDVIHIHFSDIAVPLFSSISYGARIVRHIHSDFSLGQNESTKERVMSLTKAAFLRILRSVSGNVVDVCVSPVLASRFRGGVYIPNAIAPSHIRAVEEEEAADSRRLLGIADDDRCVLVFSWSPLVKGLDVAVNAIDLLNQRKENFTLLVVCGEDFSVAKRFIDSRCECGSQVPFIKYLPPVEDVSLYHAVSDIYLSSSRSEGFSTSLMEALLFERACVISDIEGTSWARAYESVFAFESGNSLLCADSLEHAAKWLEREGTSVVLSNVSSKLNADYSIDDWCNRLYDIYLG